MNGIDFEFLVKNFGPIISLLCIVIWVLWRKVNRTQACLDSAKDTVITELRTRGNDWRDRYVKLADLCAQARCPNQNLGITDATPSRGKP